MHFSTGYFQKENIVYAGILQIFHTHTRWDIDNSAFDAWWDKFW
jgi:hypothetical protein